MKEPICTDKLISEVEKLVSLGVLPLVAVMAQGVSQETFFAWIDPKNVSQESHKLRKSILRAETDFEALLVGKVVAASEEHWQAAAWMAERRFPERYVRKSVNAKEESAEEGPLDPFADLDDAAKVVQIRARKK